MSKRANIGQLFLRLALGIGFLLPVMDRLGWLGAPGTLRVAWGNWSNFVRYTNVLLPFLSHGIAEVMAFLTTLAEATLGICLILGYKTKVMAMGSFLLTLIFAVCMATFLGVGAPFSYPVLVFTGSGLLLSGMPVYKWSLDELLRR